MTQAEVRTALINAGVVTPCTFLADTYYKPCRADWLTGEFDDWFRAALKALDLEKWVEENGDCDDKACLYSVLARICHAKTPGSAGTALPVGELWFTQKTGGGHAVNVAVTSDQGVVFIEPQIRKTVLRLHNDEKASAFLAKL